MSYCRWSSDDFHCDLYCFEHVDGYYQTYVAGNRVLGDIPKIPDLRKVKNMQEWVDAENAQMNFLETAKRVPIGLPYDGASFQDKTLEDFLWRLLWLRQVGYNFPNYVFDSIRYDIQARDFPGMVGLMRFLRWPIHTIRMELTLRQLNKRKKEG